MNVSVVSFTREDDNIEVVFDLQRRTFLCYQHYLAWEIKEYLGKLILAMLS